MFETRGRDARVRRSVVMRARVGAGERVARVVRARGTRERVVRSSRVVPLEAGGRRRAIACSGVGVDELAFCATSAYALYGVLRCARAARGSERDVEFASSLAWLAPACAAYGALLVRSWTPETLSLMMPGTLEEGLATGKVQFIPTLSSITALLSARATAASAWTHLLCVNMFVARHVALKMFERLRRDGVAPPSAHTFVLATLVGPLALLSHVVSCFVFDRFIRRRDASRRVEATTSA